MRAVVYTRYSSSNQREASIEDQVEVCRRYIELQGWQVIEVYADRALSGASDKRPAYRQLLADAERKGFEVVVCEAIDRLGRKLADIAALHDQLQFQGIALHAVNLGQITTLHIGLLGTMAQLYLSDLKDKTKRGQLGRALAGKIPSARSTRPKLPLCVGSFGSLPPGSRRAPSPSPSTPRTCLVRAAESGATPRSAVSSSGAPGS
jgi:DNA invertase Pin-like site-specific DNA recombinase